MDRIGKSDLCFKVAIYKAIEDMGLEGSDKAILQDLIVNWLDEKPLALYDS